MKKIVLIVIALVALVSLSGLGYLAFVHQSVSKMMIQATEEMRNGNTKKAKDLLIQVIRRDNGNEPAYRMLAELSETQKDFLSGVYLWAEVCRLNPLDKTSRPKLYRCAFLSGATDVALREFEANKPIDDLPDSILYRIAIGSLRGSPETVMEIKAALVKRNSPYATLLAANEDYFSNVPNSFAKFEEIANSNTAPEVLDCVNVILATDSTARGDLVKVKEYLAKVTGKDEYAAMDVKLLSAQCAVTEGRVEDACRLFGEVYELQRSNISLLLSYSELAFVTGNLQVLQSLREELNVGSKAGLALDYYIRALCSSLEGKPEDALKSLDLAGVFQERVSARVLKFKLACDLGDLETAAKSGEILASPRLSDKLKEVLAAHLLELISKAEKESNQKMAKSFANSLYMIAPEQPVAIGYSMITALEQDNFPQVLKLSNDLLKVNPKNEPAFEAKCLALFGLNRINDGLKYAETTLKENPTNMVACIFSARFASRLGEVDKAAQLYESAVNSVPLNICEEGGNYIIANQKNSEKYLTALDESGDASKQMLAKGLRARISLMQGDTSAAEADLREAIKLNPKAPGVRSALASLVYSLGKKDEAQTVLEEAIKEIPDSEDLKIRLAALLLESDSESDAKTVLSILEKICTPEQKNAFPYAIRSSAQHTLGREKDALESARYAVSLRTGGAEPFLQLGLRYLEQRRYSDSVENLTRAYEITPQDSRVHKSLPEAFKGVISGSPNAFVKKSYAEAWLKMIPEDEDAKTVLKEANDIIATEDAAKAKADEEAAKAAAAKAAAQAAKDESPAP